MDRRKRLKYGSYAFILTVIAVGIFVLVNLIASSQNWSIDLTQNKMYSLSDQTKQVLSKLNQDINVRVLYIKGREDAKISRMLENYKKHNQHIKVEYLDVLRHPELGKKYTDIKMDINQNPEVVIFETGKRVKAVNYYELSSYYDSSYQSEAEFYGEQKFTNAIRFVTAESIPVVYFMEGHKEMIVEVAKEALKSENYLVKQLNLLKAKTVPDDAEMLVIASPQINYLPQEINEMERYFNNGGKAMFFFDPSIDVSGLKSMIDKWGAEINDDLVMEGNPEKIYAQPNRIFADINSHEITSKLIESKLNVIVAFPRSFKLLLPSGGQSSSGYKIDSILKSSESSWSKTNLDWSNLKSEDLGKKSGDVSGTMNLAVAVSKKISGQENKEMRAVVFGSSYLVSDQDPYLQGGVPPINNSGNMDLFLNTASWLKGTPEEITIRPKQTLNSPITMSEGARYKTIGLVLIGIPGIVLVTGIVVWARRRHL